MTHRINNLDDLIINQGYMSERTKSPRRMNQQQFFENEMMYNNGISNVNKLNSGRDMSPNKILAKNKPLVSNNNINQQQQYYGYPNNTQQQQGHINNNTKINMGNYQLNNQQQNGMLSNFSTLQHNTINKASHNNNNLLYPVQNNSQIYGGNKNTTSNNWRNPKSPRSPQELPIGQQQSNTRSCANHVNKKAEFMTETDGEIIYYCQTCAAKLAAQQFEVIKLPVGNFAIGNVNNASNNNGLIGYVEKPQQQQFYGAGMNIKNNLMNKQSTLQRRRREIPNLPQYKNNPVYESIIEFLKEIYTVEQYHYETHSELEQIDEHYTQQISMVDEFYNQLMEILQKMHQDHVTDIQTEFKKHSQMKDIYINEIYENLETIEQIVNDLDENFETVVNKITSEDIQFFNEALEKNRSNIRFFCNQIEQQKDMLSEVVSYKEERLMDMIEEFENCLVDLWQDKKEERNEKVKGNSNINISSNVRSNNQCLNSNNMFNNNKGPIMRQEHPHTNAQSNQINLNNILQPNNRQESNNTPKNEEQQKINILQIHQNQPKTSTLTRDFEGKGACRQIFEDDEEENLTQQISPKFKNI